MRIRRKVPKDHKPVPKSPREASESEMNEKAIRDAFSNYDDNQPFNLVIYYISGNSQSFSITGKESIIQLIIAKMNQDNSKVIIIRNKVGVIDFSKVEYIEVNPIKEKDK